MSLLWDALPDRQFGFIKARSTTHAINQVVRIIMNKCANNNNTARYCIALIEDYFRSRKVLISPKIKLQVSDTVPQGSVLGSTLWNVLYYGVLELPLVEGATTIAYANDLALIVGADAQETSFLRQMT